MSKEFPQVKTKEFGMDTSKIKPQGTIKKVGSGIPTTKGLNDPMTEKVSPMPGKLK